MGGEKALSFIFTQILSSIHTMFRLSSSPDLVLSTKCVRISPHGVLLVGQLVHMHGDRAGLVALLVVFGHVHVALGVARVVGHPHGHWGPRYGHLDTGRGREDSNKLSPMRRMKT